MGVIFPKPERDGKRIEIRYTRGGSLYDRLAAGFDYTRRFSLFADNKGPNTGFRPVRIIP
jgi:hypothetical protein